MEITDEAVSLGSDGILVQNLGPDPIYLGEANVVAGSGVVVEVDQAIIIATSNNKVYAVSDGVSDVRLLGRGLGMFSSPEA